MPEEKFMTQEELTKFLTDNVVAPATADMKAQMDALKAEVAKNSPVKKIVPDMEGTFADGCGKTFAGTVFDMSAVSASRKSILDMNEIDVASSFMSQGGFFRKLSPALEAMGMYIKGKGRIFDPSKMATLAADQYKALGMKAATGMGEGNVGFDIPIEFPAIIIEAAIASDPILSLLWRFPMNDSIVSFPKLSQSDDDYFGGVTMEWTGAASETTLEGATGGGGEGSSMNPTKPTTTKNVFTAKKVTANVILTDELIQDSPINILNWITGLLIKKFRYDLQRVVLKGNGTTEPLGITRDPVVVANSIGRVKASDISYKDIVKLEAALNEIFDNEFFVTRKATMGQIRSQEDGNGRPIWYEGYASAMDSKLRGPSILGVPYHVTRNVPTLGTTGDMIIGDFGMYMLGMRSDMRIDVSDAPGFRKNETDVRFIARADGKPGTSFAFKVLKSTLS